MPTGGVDTTRESIEAWFKAGVCAVGMGSKLISKKLMEAKEYASIESDTRTVLQLIKEIKKIILTQNINRIGYNPFAGCANLIIESNNEHFKEENGILYNHDFTLIICCPNLAAGNYIKIKNSVQSINRSGFSGCMNLKKIDFS
jgi:hypothetical protein